MALLLQVHNICKSYRKGRPILNQIHLTVGKGEIVGLVGESGSGKSTLAKVIMQLEAPDKGGAVYFQQQPITKHHRPQLL